MSVVTGNGDQADAALTRQQGVSSGPETRELGRPPAHAESGNDPQPTRQFVSPAGPETRSPQATPTEQRGTPRFIDRNLPPELAERFTPIRELNVGGQAAVLLCQRKTEAEELVAIKLYNHAAPASGDDPRELLRSIPGKYAVSYVEPNYGTANGKWWEVHEYLAEGSVREFAASRGGRLQRDQLVDLVRCMTVALDHLHARVPKIIHRDIKPANILIRSVSPFRVVLADFGLAILTDSTMTMRSHSRTEAYASPESASGDTRPARDWWALGMTVAELAAGRHPFQMEDGRFLSDGRIQSSLATKPVPLDHIDDSRLLLLLRGLLTRDPDQRWEQSQVSDWLDGVDPALGSEWTSPSTPEHADVVPLRFLGAEFTDPAMLARAIAQDWQQAGKSLAGRDLDRVVDWIDDVALDRSIRGLVASYSAGRKSKNSAAGNLNLLMAKIVSRLDPDGTPIFMGELVDARSISGWASRLAHEADGHLKTIVEELYRTQALREYRRMSGHGPLERIQEHWEDLSVQSERYFSQVPKAGEVTPEIRAICLYLAVVRYTEEASN